MNSDEIVGPARPSDQAWFWTEEWERETQAEIYAGLGTVYNSTFDKERLQ